MASMPSALLLTLHTITPQQQHPASSATQAHQVAMVASMPSAAQAMPYMCATVKPTKMASAMMKQGMMVDL